MTTSKRPAKPFLFSVHEQNPIGVNARGLEDAHGMLGRRAEVCGTRKCIRSANQLFVRDA